MPQTYSTSRLSSGIFAAQQQQLLLWTRLCGICYRRMYTLACHNDLFVQPDVYSRRDCVQCCIAVWIFSARPLARNPRCVAGVGLPPARRRPTVGGTSLSRCQTRETDETSWTEPGPSAEPRSGAEARASASALYSSSPIPGRRRRRPRFSPRGVRRSRRTSSTQFGFGCQLVLRALRRCVHLALSRAAEGCVKLISSSFSALWKPVMF